MSSENQAAAELPPNYVELDRQPDEPTWEEIQRHVERKRKAEEAARQASRWDFEERFGFDQ